MHGTAPIANYPAQSVNTVEVEKPCFSVTYEKLLILCKKKLQNSRDGLIPILFLKYVHTPMKRLKYVPGVQNGHPEQVEYFFKYLFIFQVSYN